MEQLNTNSYVPDRNEKKNLEIMQNLNEKSLKKDLNNNLYDNVSIKAFIDAIDRYQ